jgi:hypothetical protein
LGGYFYKSLTEQGEWKFEPNPHIDTSQPLEKTRSFAGSNIKRLTADYAGESKLKVPFRLLNFGPLSSHPVLRVKLGSTAYDLPIHMRLGPKTFLGKSHKLYEIVLPKAMIPDSDPVFAAFGKRRVIPLKLKNINHNGQHAIKLSMDGKHPLFPILMEEK